MARAEVPTVSTPSELIADHPCVQCLDPKERLIALVYLLSVVNSLTLPGDIDDIMEGSCSYSCASDTQLIDSVISALWTAVASGTTMAEVREATTCLQCVSDRKLRELIAYLSNMYSENGTYSANPE